MATSYTLNLDVAQCQAISGDYAFQLVTDTTRRTLNRAIVLTPVRFGNLRGGNRHRVLRRSVSVTTGEVFNEIEYAAAVHDGSKAYTIRPKRKWARTKPKRGGKRRRASLRFVVNGEVVFAKSVRMPARRGRPWLLRALREVAGPDGYRITT